MTSRSLLSVLTAAAMLTGCSSSNPGTGGQGGSGGQSSGGSSASGGESSHGGSATGDSSSSGGTLTGGTTASGGQTAGGTTGQGGSGSGGTGGAFGSAAGGQGGTSKTGGTTGNADASVTGGAGGGNSGGASGTGGAAGSGSGGTVVATGGTKAVGGSLGGGGATPGSGGSGPGGTSGTAGSTGTQHWVGTWTASPYVDTNSSNTPPISLSNSAVRQIAHVSLGGSQIRVQFSNLQGNGSLAITGAHIALTKSSTLADSTIDTTTDKALAFSGSASVTVAAGKEVWSDPIDFTVSNQGNVTITTLFGTVPSTITQHSGSRTTSYFKSGGAAADLSAATMSSAQTKVLWFFISGIDVMADASAVGVVAIGDSITDGRGTDNDKNNRWTDIMAARLQANAATKNVATMNQGIGATNLVGTGGTAAQARFARDVLGQSGVKYVVVLDGVNDIHGGTSYSSMKSAYDDLIKRAHDKGLKIYGGTILPFGGSSDYYSASAESTRQQVNTYIKSGVFDGVIDFDAALTDGGNPPKLKAEYAAWTPNNPQGSADGLHPGTAGYQKMGETPDLTLFTK